ILCATGSCSISTCDRTQPSGRCVASLGVGDACGGTICGECGSGLACTTGRCEPPPGAPSICTSDVGAASDAGAAPDVAAEKAACESYYDAVCAKAMECHAGDRLAECQVRRAACPNALFASGS